MRNIFFLKHLKSSSLFQHDENRYRKKLKTNFLEKLENMVKISFSKTNNMICFLTLYSH